MHFNWKAALFFVVIFVAVGATAYIVQPSQNAAVTAQSPAPDTAAAKAAAPSLFDEWNSHPEDRARYVVSALLMMAAAAIGLAIIGSTTMLRDAQPLDFGNATLPKGQLRWVHTYSLGMAQMAWWFLLILCGYLYILFYTHDYNTITAQVLSLMGIGTAGALGSAMINQSKSSDNLTVFTAAVAAYRAFRLSNTANDALASALDAALLGGVPAAIAVARTNADTAQAGISAAFIQRDSLAPEFQTQGFLTDILSDVSGLSLHRFQNLVWTLILGGIFVAVVAIMQKFPDFDPTVLALMGLSQGIYLGFKVQNPN